MFGEPSPLLHPAAISSGKPARPLFVGPGLVRIGGGALQHVGAIVAAWGARCLVVAGNRAYRAAGDAMERSLAAAQVAWSVTSNGGECSEDELSRLRKLALNRSPAERVQAIVGMGGGKAIDAAKLLAFRLDLPVVTVPTSAATCAAWTALSNVYTPEGAWERGVALPTNPRAVLVDHDVIASAPARLLASGIGDTLAKWYETSASVRLETADASTRAAHAMAAHLRDTLFDRGAEAIEELRSGRPGTAFQLVVDANVALAGTVGGLGGERCRSVAAHGLCNALTALPGNAGSWHGEKVAFGIVVQSLLLGLPVDEIERLVEFFRAVGLPLTMGELGYGEDPDTLRQAAEGACREGNTMHHLPFPVAPSDVLAAIEEAQRLGKRGVRR